jgi:hypothetical protein
MIRRHVPTVKIERARQARKVCESLHTEPAHLRFDPIGDIES